MSATRSAVKKTVPVERATSQLVPFVWEGTDNRGVKMKGEQPAKNANLLKAELRRQGITPSVVKPKPKPLFGGAAKKISPRDIAVFSRQLATMMKSGVPIVMALEIIGGGNKNPAMKKMVTGLKADIEVLAKRVARRDTRPLLRGKDPLEVLRGLAEKRYPIYGEADIVVDTPDSAHDMAVERILAALKAWLA